MTGAPGSKSFFEGFSVPGLKPESVNSTQGHVHVTLAANQGMDVEALRSQYINEITPLLPIGQSITVSIVSQLCG